MEERHKESDTPALVKLGLCGFTMAAEDYFRSFPLVEVQQTFYQPPGIETLERWRAIAPAGFEFTIKAWQLITHESRSRTYRRLKRPLTDDEKQDCGAFRWTPIVEEGWKTTLRCATVLRATAVLFQCPASFRPTNENVNRMHHFFRMIGRVQGLRYLWEPRGVWPHELISSICSELDLVHVVDPFVNRTVTPDSIYYRLHGITGSRHVYSDQELRKLLEMIPSTGDPYVLFNNMPRIGDAVRFRKLLSEHRNG
ncbi:MAG TPA: DUF72 domain-containing protein [Thermoanaerobaculia bacterium]|nr:DUF72 domain-containing protein [Thermoanaerobaculia bacterium]